MPTLPVRATITPLSGAAQGVAIEFHGWTGWVGELENVMDRYRRPGARGNGAQAVGQELGKACRGWRQELNATSAGLWIGHLQAAIGPVVGIKDPRSRTLPRCRISGLEFDVKDGKGGQVAGSALATVLIQVSFTVERLLDA